MADFSLGVKRAERLIKRCQVRAGGERDRARIVLETIVSQTRFINNNAFRARCSLLGVAYIFISLYTRARIRSRITGSNIFAPL